MKQTSIAVAAMTALVPFAAGAEPMPERVIFPSADGKTTLIGYVFAPAAPALNARASAVALMHGRGGVYSTRAKGVYDAATISQRHVFWARLWAAQGYLAILVDGFGPRGQPAGFARGTARSRPAAFNEVTVRPSDAYGALAYLRTRADVAPERIALMGWSNGASATLSAMAANGPGGEGLTPQTGFRAALAFYPGCGLRGRYKAAYRPYAPVRLFIGSADEEVMPARCERLVARSRAEGGDIALTVYPDATHGFDDPGRKRQSAPANAAARAAAVEQAKAFFTTELAR